MGIKMKSLGQKWIIEDDNIEIVGKFTYFGSKLNNKNTLEQEIRYRITTGTELICSTY